ncbi:tRNA uridine-5-carboxymethylaminomethyl(34) synthesis GTPase MnmE [Geobacter sp. SVR]|uniref:tRNA uridine-5-carboxymethylaminomethyl(34) synthesis GTPase MnmE n=1 Tax=Geobacter sp. SVR TaxID=2495594 RepID=UPI00143EF893|nr:tRNA uridine-5-carboxymethylaminomethyl(34) synthesis GTPase MnmE [Geobacter sp. SVR]BCS56112.1 tRNA modification GTPase MnmE [Geobacter sp. SVR]GCF84875.1 tRNA modification GTPase MnmE [Geobacter sp. SVR]
MYIRDTIAAVATPPGNGGIGIVRVSGPEAAVIGEKIFKRANNGGLISHRFSFGTIRDPWSGETVDEAMAVLMKAPRSYTCEDVLELHCHGGVLVVEQVLSLCLQHGARLAEPGEFTRRAFLNGRIDLAQAEAVMDIIGSQTEAALQQAQRQREGLLSQRIEDVRSHLLKALALVEAYIDFPEDDLGDTDLNGITAEVSHAASLVDTLLSGFDEGRRLREGIAVLIIGKPNAGKSSLLNRLLNENRAIVTHLPGTTRDIIEESINLGGLPVRLLDTAGIRHTDCLVEQEGIARALEKIPQADLVLFVLDASDSFGPEDQLIREALADARTVVVLNKSDLPSQMVLPADLAAGEHVAISSRTGEGVDALRELVRSSFLRSSVDNREFIAISRARHRDALVSASRTLQSVLTGFAMGVELELAAVDLREALTAVGSVTGHVTNDDVLDVVFSSFCIGK